MLRGLRERYEIHHGVQFKDAALVAAAVLSDRYIADRFLPDKAIDLIDEAAAKLRTEIDSLPVALDEVERRIMRLEIEREALRKEKDVASAERLGRLDRDVADLKESRSRLQAQWHEEKAGIQATRSAVEELEQVRLAIERAQREGDYATASELQYGRLPELERRAAGLAVRAQERAAQDRVARDQGQAEGEREPHHDVGVPARRGDVDCAAHGEAQQDRDDRGQDMHRHGATLPARDRFAGGLRATCGPACCLRRLCSVICAALR